MYRYLALLMAGLFYFSTLVQAAEVRKLGISDMLLGPSNSTWTSPGGKVVRYFPYPFAGDGTNDNAAVIDVRAYGAMGDGSTDDTAEIQAAISAASSGDVVFIPSGTYIITSTILVRTSNISIVGTGSNSATLKVADSVGTAITVLELGNTADGNSATEYENISVVGLTLDGNYANTTEPGSDINGWGLATTKVSYSHFSDIKAKNCWLGGVGTFINSNHNRWSDIYVYNCGWSTQNEPGFDVNSSKYNTFDGIIIKDSNYGFRLLDNCHGNIVNATIYNATVTGFVYNNQIINESHSNIINVSVINGCNTNAMQIGANVRSSVVNVVIDNVYAGLYVIGQDDVLNLPTGNTFTVTSTNNSSYAILDNSAGNSYNVTSYNDGHGASVGDYFAVDIYGDNNIISALIEDVGTAYVRGIALRSGASSNRIMSYRYKNLVQNISDLGSGNLYFRGGFGDNIASSNEIFIPTDGSIFFLTGTNTITTITAPDTTGREIVLISTGNVTIVDGSNLKLSSDWVSGGPNSTLKLISDGTNWYEVSRSIN